MDLSIGNVINVSVSQSGAGIAAYNTSNLALFTKEAAGLGFGTDGYKIYLDPSEVGVDFGTSSDTFKMANTVFSQQPNILTGGGYLVILKQLTESQSIVFSAAPTSGTYELNFNGDVTAAIPYTADAATLQVFIRTLAGLEAAVVTGVPEDFVVSFDGFNGDAPLLTVTNNTMTDGAAITVAITEIVAGEDLGAAITRTESIVPYFGIMAARLVGETEGKAAAAIVQPLDKMLGLVSRTAADLDPLGYFDDIKTSGFDKTRCLYYGGVSDTEALVMEAAYLGQGLSTVFAGSNTTKTINLKELKGVSPDPTMTQTLRQKALDAGVDVYTSFGGASSVATSGANGFFDDVYNLLWFVGAIKVAGFNVLAKVLTKIPQTEDGMDSLKSAYRLVSEQGVVNRMLAPGKWTNPSTFGDQTDFYANIEQRGYYIYSIPVSQQSPVDRAARKAPLVQIAIKYAGAIHSASVIINVNK